jgi:hypothetical protein
MGELVISIGLRLIGNLILIYRRLCVAALFFERENDTDDYLIVEGL